MPYDYVSHLNRRAELAPSAAIELSWLATDCQDVAPLLPLSPDLHDRAQTFWGDGRGLMLELLVVAQQLGCLTGWDVTPMFDLTRVAITTTPDLTLETETVEERRLILARLKRLGREAPLRKATPRCFGISGWPLNRSGPSWVARQWSGRSRACSRHSTMGCRCPI